MESSKGYYSLIQYCPDLARLEAANIGVILFCPDLKFIRAKVAQGNDRIRRFFGSQDDDWAQINTVKNTIVNRLEVTGKDFKSLDDLTNFIATRVERGPSHRAALDEGVGTDKRSRRVVRRACRGPVQATIEIHRAIRGEGA